MSAILNEQTKLLAAAVNNIAVALVVIGVVTPVTAMSFGIASAPALSLPTVSFAAVWLCAAAILHSIGRRVLRSLKP